MPIPNPSLRHLFPSSTPNPNLVFTPDDSVLHTANGRIQLTDVGRGRTRTLPFEATRNLTSISHARNRVLTTDESSRAAVFAPPFARPFARLSLNFRVLTALISPCAEYAAFFGEKLEIWRVPKHPIPTFAAWEKVAEFAPGLTSTACIAWSPDSKRVAVGSNSGIVTVYTISEARMQGVSIKPLILHGHRAPIVTVRFVGERGFISLSNDGALFRWGLRYNDLAPDYQPQEYEFAKDNPSRNPKRRMFTVPMSAKLLTRHFVKQAGAKRVRSADVADPLLVVGLSNGVFALYELPDSGYNTDDEDFAIFEDDEDGGASKQVHFTDLTLLHTLSVFGGSISRIAFNRSGAWIGMASSETGQMVIWDWRAETHVLKQQGHTLSAQSVAFSPDGRAVATGSKDGRVKLWGVHTGFCVATFSNHEAAVSALTFSANDVIVSASYDGTVRAYDIRRYRNFRVMVGPPPRRQFGCVAADGAGELIAAGCVDTFEIVVWSLRTGQVLEVLNGHKGPVSGLMFRPLRGTLASASWDRTVRLWDMYERKGSCEVLEHNKEVLDVTFRPDGREVAACTTSGEIVIWGADDGTIVGTIDGARDAAGGRSHESHTVAKEKGHFQTVAYSADGQFLLAGAAAKHLCVFHVAHGHRPTLVSKTAVTENKQFDGLLTELNSRNVMDNGLVIQQVDDDDEDADSFHGASVARHKSLPGARAEAELQRKQLVIAEVRHVAVCATGQLWGLVTGEGVLIYMGGSGILDNDDDDDAMLFDPTHLDVDVTPDAARAAAQSGDYVAAVVVALRLGERDVLNDVVQSVPFTDVALTVQQIPGSYFAKLVALVAWRLENSPHLEFDLTWARALLLQHAAQVKNKGIDMGKVNATLRALHRACAAHTKRLAPIADQNEAMLDYLLSVNERRRVTSGGGGE